MHEQGSLRKLCPDSKVVKLHRGSTGQLSSCCLHLSFWVTDKVRVTLEKTYSGRCGHNPIRNSVQQMRDISDCPFLYPIHGLVPGRGVGRGEY
jgi:hypothetical protein